ncbi:MAG: succinate dehydrogenase, hydrophobic membrane anchor protein, partial [Methylococcaceae bacterium]|nr:succinate dehydrogenase, hydrophobic membrane anchor protein [Methylococcaceae bacterium]
SAHWWMQRITAIILIPLTFWMVAFIKQLGNADHTQITAWLSEPFNSALAISFIFAAFYHAALGLQIVIEDYVHTESYKITAVWTVKLSFLFLGLTAVLAILRIILS